LSKVADGDQGNQSSSQGANQSQPGGTSVPANGSSNTQTQTQQSAAQNNGAQQQQATQQTQPSTRPEWAPEKYWDASKNEVKGADLRKDFDELVAFKAADDSRRLTLPQKADDYRTELPQSFQLPQGVDFKIDAANPLWAQAKAWAHKAGLTQEQFAEGIALIAGDRIGTQATIKAAYDAEITKLGAAGPARVDAVTTWMAAVGGEKNGKALANILKMAPVASTIEALEAVMQKMQTQGGGSFNTRGREPDASQRVDDATYDKMSYAEKKAYAERFPQQQTNGAAA
jgi:hypothetical protein